MAIFYENIPVSGTTTASGQYTITVQKANEISSVYSVSGILSGYIPSVVSFSGKSITLQFYEAASVEGALPALSAAVAISGDLGVIYEGI